MRLHDISLNNLKRRKAKAAFLIIGLLIGVTTAVTLITLTRVMEEDMGKKMDQLGANILIVPKSHDLALSFGGLQLSGVSLDVKPLHSEDIKKIQKIKNNENLSIVAPKLIGALALGGKDIFLAGVDFNEELRLKRWWKIAPLTAMVPMEKMAHGPAGDMIMAHAPETAAKSAWQLKDELQENDLLAGATVARLLGLSEGKSLEIRGETFQVRAVLEETGSQDDLLLFADLLEVQKVLGRKGELSLIEVAAFCNTCPIEEMVQQLGETLPGAKVTAIKQAVESRMETVKHFRRFSLGISGIVLFIGSLIVFTTMMASVNERTREIGIFRAIGFRKRHIVQVILLEAFLIGLLAGLLGYATGVGFSRLTLPFFLQSPGVSIPWDYTMIMLATGLSVLLALLASTYPALRAARMDPTEALRAI